MIRKFPGHLLTRVSGRPTSLRLCSFKGCRKVGEFRPILICPCPKEDREVNQKIELELTICDHHRHAGVDAYVSDEGWNYYKGILAQVGLTTDRKKLSLEFEPIPEIQVISPQEMERIMKHHGD